MFHCFFVFFSMSPMLLFRKQIVHIVTFFPCCHYGCGCVYWVTIQWREFPLWRIFTNNLRRSKQQLEKQKEMLKWKQCSFDLYCRIACTKTTTTNLAFHVLLLLQSKWKYKASKPHIDTTVKVERDHEV